MKTRTMSVAGAVVAIAALIAVFVLMRGSSSGGAPQIKVTDVYASETVSTSSAMYMTIENSGGSDELVAAVVSGVGQVTLHGSDMAPRPDMSVKGHRTTTLEPGGAHVMLENLDNPLKPGQQLGVRLLFKKFGSVDVTADVLSYDQINAKIAS
jgi:periplasmic copper chaperone A